FAGTGRALIGRELGARKDSAGAAVEAKEVVGVDPVEIEQQRQGLTHPNVSKDGASCIEYKKLGRLRQAVHDNVADHPPALDGRCVITALPAQWLVFEAHVIEAARERLEMTVGLAEVTEVDLVEIP